MKYKPWLVIIVFLTGGIFLAYQELLMPGWDTLATDSSNARAFNFIGDEEWGVGKLITEIAFIWGLVIGIIVGWFMGEKYGT